MGYLAEVKINDFTFKVGNLDYPVFGFGAFINFEDEDINLAIKNGDDSFYSAIKALINMHEELDALYTMKYFRRDSLCGHEWYALKERYSFEYLEKFKRKALIVLNSKLADDDHRYNAQTIINILNGNLIPRRPEKSPEEKAKSAFENKKPGLRLKLTIRDGYKCDCCSKNTEGSLCIIRKDNENDSYEIDNLLLRCRSCISKHKNKK